MTGWSREYIVVQGEKVHHRPDGVMPSEIIVAKGISDEDTKPIILNVRNGVILCMNAELQKETLVSL